MKISILKYNTWIDCIIHFVIGAFLQIHEIACILYDNIGVNGSPSETFTSELLENISNLLGN